MVVGQSGVGKTSLIKRLLNQEVDIEERKATDGIDVHVRSCKVSLDTKYWIVQSADNPMDNTSSRMIGVLDSMMKSTEDQTINISDSIENSESSNGECSSFGDCSDVKITLKSISSDTIPDTESSGSEQYLTDEVTDDNIASNPVFSDANQSRVSETSNLQILEAKRLVQEDEKAKKELQLLLTEEIDRNDHAYVSFWDFGGQRVFYTTHQMFLTDRAIYILTTDMSQDIDDSIDVHMPYFDDIGIDNLKSEDFIDIWLNSIHGHSKSDTPGVPPVILVGTHADKLNEDKKDKEKKSHFLAIRDRFAGTDVGKHFVDRDFGLSNTSQDPQIKDLQDTIIAEAKKQRWWGELKPAKFIQLEKLLQEKRNANIEIITRCEVEELTRMLTVPIAPDELDLFLRFQRDCGYIMHFTVPQLADKIVLSPQFLVNALKSLITADMFREKNTDWLAFSKTGILTNDLIDLAWKGEKYQSFHKNKQHVLALMEHLHIIARPLRYVDGEDEVSAETRKEDNYFVPCMLPPPPQSTLCSTEKYASTSCLCFVLNNIAFPGAIFNRLIADCLRLWPVATNNKTRALYSGFGQFDLDKQRQHRLTLSLSSNVIQLRITKFSMDDPCPKPDLCREIRETIKHSIDSIGNMLSLDLNIEACVKCPAASPDSVRCLHAVKKLQECNGEFACHDHNDLAMLQSSDLLKYWFGTEVTSQVRWMEELGFNRRSTFFQTFLSGDDDE